MADRAVLFIAVSTEEQAEDEKSSLETQEAALLATAARFGWEIVDTIRIPGASRRHYTWMDFCEAAARQKEPIHDPMRMYDHWKRRDFDVLAAWHTDRLGREQSILAEVIQRTIDAGARVWTEKDGEIDAQRYRGVIAISGFAAASAVDDLNARRAFGIMRRFERGLPVNLVKWTHLPIRDSRGKIVTLEVDEGKRRLFDDIYDLVVNERHAWRGIEKALAARGHAELTRYQVYRMLYHPITWGHVTFHGARAGSGNCGRWAYGAIPPPDGVTMNWNAVPAVYTGAQAERLQSELERRHTARGHGGQPRYTRWYTGLFICGECGLTLGSASATQLRCQGKFLVPRKCEKGNRVNVTELQAYVDRLLRDVIARGQFAPAPDEPARASEIAQIDGELNAATQEIDALIDQQVKAHPAARDRYQARIDELGTRIQALNQRRSAVENAARRAERQSVSEQIAITRLRDTITDLWARPPAEINQLLHAVFGRWRIVVQDNHPVGLRSLA